MINEISIKNQNQNTNLEVNDQINEKKDLKNQRFNRINKEKETKRIEKTVEETTIIKQSDLVNPLENERNAFHFRVHVTGYIESGYVSKPYINSYSFHILYVFSFSFMMETQFTANTTLSQESTGHKKTEFLMDKHNTPAEVSLTMTIWSGTCLLRYHIDQSIQVAGRKL